MLIRIKDNFFKGKLIFMFVKKLYNVAKFLETVTFKSLLVGPYIVSLL